MNKLVGGIRLALAQFRELEAFAQFASDLDETTRKQLELGARITELLKQKQYEPMTVAEMAVVFYVADKGYLDDVDVKQIVDFEQALLAYARDEHADLLKTINDKLTYDEEIEKGLKACVEGFKKTGTW